MSRSRPALGPRLGLGLLAFSALFFFTSLEDAYLLPQRLGLAFGALGLVAGAWVLPLPLSPVFAVGLLFFVWRGVCHAVSPDAPTGPWFAVQIPELILFLGAAAALLQPALRKRTALALLAAGGLGAAYALLAPLGWDPFSSGAVDLGFGRRAHGTLGNPDFLGGWLAMLLPLALTCGLATRSRARVWAFGLAGLLAAALALTLVRGSWVAACVGCAVSGAVMGPGLVKGSAWNARTALPWVAGLALALSLLAVLGLGSSALKGRLREAADIHSDAWGSRVFMVAVAADLAREHPLTGVGGGSFEMEYLRRQGERLWTERSQPFRLTEDAHNDWLQAAAETGFVGLLLWAAFFFLALRAAWRQGGAEGAAVAGALAAFGVQGCFHFPWDITPTVALALLALAAAAGFGDPGRFEGAKGWPALAALALIACLGLDLRQAGASALLNSGTALQTTASARPLAGALLKAAGALEPADERAWSRLGGDQMDQGDFSSAVASYQKALQCLPSSYQDWTNLGLCLGQTGRLAGAEASLKQAAHLNPRSNEAWADWVKVVYLLGRKDEAMGLARQGIAQAGGSAQAWFNLGAMLYNAGRRGEAAGAFEAALRLDPLYPQAGHFLGLCRRGV